LRQVLPGFSSFARWAGTPPWPPSLASSPAWLFFVRSLGGSASWPPSLASIPAWLFLVRSLGGYASLASLTCVKSCLGWLGGVHSTDLSPASDFARGSSFVRCRC